MSKIHLSTGTAEHLAEYGQHTIRCRPLVTVEVARTVDRETLLGLGTGKACKACLRFAATADAPRQNPIAVDFDPTPYAPARGASELDPVAVRSIAFSIEGEVPEQFNDLGHALWAWSHPLPWHDGLKSNGHDADQRGGDGERIPNAPLYRILPVAKAIEAACAPGYHRAGGERRVGTVRLDANDCARIVRGILGAPREPAISAQQIADDLNADADRLARGEHAVTAQQVGRAWAHLRREIGAWLWSRKLLVRKPREKTSGPLARAHDLQYSAGRGQDLSEGTMRIDGLDCEGWAQIAGALGCSEQHARALAKAPNKDPMPVSRVGSRVCASTSDLRAWASRQVKPYQRGAA